VKIYFNTPKLSTLTDTDKEVVQSSSDMNQAFRYSGFEIICKETEIINSHTGKKELVSAKNKNYNTEGISIHGFYTNLRFSSNSTNDFSFNSLDFKVKLFYQYMSKEAGAVVKYKNVENGMKCGFSGDPFISLTGISATTYRNNVLKKNFITSLSDLFITTSQDQYNKVVEPYNKLQPRQDFKSYKIYVIKQAKSITDLLQQIIYSTDARITSDQRSTATEYFGFINSFSPIDSTEKQYLFPRYASGDGYSSTGLLDFLNSCSSVTGRRFSLAVPGVLEYSEVDVYNLFINNIHHNYYGLSLNYGDSLVMVSNLNELVQQEVHSDKKLGISWTAKKGYLYYNLTSCTFDSKINSGTFVTTYTNTPDNYELSTSKQDYEPSGWQKFWGNNVAGMFNGSKRYAGTFINRVSATIIPDALDYSNFTESTNAVLTIDKADENRLPSKILDWYDMPVSNAIIGLVTVGLVLATGGLISLLLYESISYALTGKDLVTAVANINYAFDGHWL